MSSPHVAVEDAQVDGGVAESVRSGDSSTAEYEPGVDVNLNRGGEPVTSG
jgi:hypothetical protein